MWKKALSAISYDEGKTWTTPVKSSSIITDSAKEWGQKTADGRYAIFYNPTKDGNHRFPLSIITGDDGIIFDNLLTVHGDVAPRRYVGKEKSYGPQYVRGIVEGNGTPPGSNLWVTYSNNKEDIWVSQIPLPVKGIFDENVSDDFNQPDGDLYWNIYSPKWATVRIADFPSTTNRSLELRDEDPYDYAKVERVFPETDFVTIKFKVLAKQINTGKLEIELLDRHGNRPPVLLAFDDKGQITAYDARKLAVSVLAKYQQNKWYEIILDVNSEKNYFNILIDGKRVLQKAETINPVDSFEKISFRTGDYRFEPNYRTPVTPGTDLPNTGKKVPASDFCIDDVQVTSNK